MGTWSLYKAGSHLIDLPVKRSPLLQLTNSMTVTVDPHTGTPTATGDARYNPAPIRLSVYLSAGDGEAVLTLLRELSGYLRGADELRYDDGTDYVRRAGEAQALTVDVIRLATGYLEGEVVWLPSEPYWRNSNGDEVMLP